MVMAFADTTVDSYTTGLATFSAAIEHLYGAGTDVFGVSAVALIAVATYLFTDVGKSHGSIAGAFTAAKSVAATLGRQDALAAMGDARVPLLLKGIHRADKVRKRPERLPVTMWMISAFFSSIEAPSAADITLTGVAVVGLTGLLRASEYVKKAPYGCTLRRRHYADLGDRVVLRLVRSKTDTFEESVDVVYFAVGGQWCPVRWLRLLWASAPDRSLDAPLLQTKHGQAITYAQLQAFLKRVSKAAGVDSGRVSTHSLRIGGATTLFELGVSADIVKKRGRWISECYQRYQRISDATLKRIARAFAETAESRSHGMVGSQTIAEACSTSSVTLDACSTRLGRKIRAPLKLADCVRE